MTNYNNLDYVAVRYYLIFDNKVDAYIFSRTGVSQTDNMKSLKNMAWAYFKRPEIQKLIHIERERFIDNIPALLERFEVKNYIGQNDNKNNQPIDNNTDISEELNKEQAKKVLINLINTNKTDAKTVSQAMQLLSKLEQWEKEKTVTNSNITFYELPKKSST